MNKCIVNAITNELIAYVSDEHENIVIDGYEIIDYGNNEPIFEDINGIVFVKENAFELKMGRSGQMAKRELCYKEDVKKNHEKWVGYLDEDMIARLNIAVDKHIPTFTEQNIVTPCLDRLKTQICNLTAEYDTETVHIDALMDLIDDLLSEQGE